MTGDEPAAFPWHRPDPMEQPVEYVGCRHAAPISTVRLRTGLTAHVVTRYEHVRELMADARASSDRSHPGYPYYIDVPEEFRTGAGFLGLDPPSHTVQRRLAVMSGEFTKPRVRAMLPRLQEIVDRCVSGMLATGPPVDLVQTLALRVPLTAVCGILGIPESDHEFLHDRTDVLLSGASTPELRSAAFSQVNEYLEQLVHARDRGSGDDLISRMIRRYRHEGIYEPADIVNNLRLMINAGHETTAAMIALGVLVLLEHPDQLAALNSDPDSLAEGAVEELLRFLSPADLATCRVAATDIEIGGVTIPAGEGIILLGLSANRDQAAFEDPDRFDIRRGARHHLAFGSGPHHCIGAELARAELAIVLKTLFRRVPGMRLVKPRRELSYKDGSVVYSVYEMLVTW